MTKRHSTTALLGLCLCASLWLSACSTAEEAAHRADVAAQQRDFDQQTGILVKHMKALQAKGDPLGDYYYALANSDGWLHDVTDPKAITALFEKAAAKGSMDAKILLALQVAMSEPVPGKLDYGQGPRENLDSWERGLALLLPLLKQQCFVRRLVLDMGKPQVASYSIARKVWPTFRDGYYRNNSDGSRTLLRDPERQRVWESVHRSCLVPQDEWLH
ncbi:MAG: hypothetical protein KDF54_02290 [Hydrogenophaga sp.]|nr:hypothetical protein [Hydrogenophaga sp.]